MKGVLKLIGVGLGLLLGTGCLELDSALNVSGDGSGSFSTHVSLGPTLVRMMDSMAGSNPQMQQLMADGAPHKLKGADRKALEAEGFSDIVVSVKQSKKGWTWDQGASFPSVGALPALGERMGGAVPQAAIFKMDDGSYVLEFTPGRDGEKSGEAPKPDMSQEQIQDMMKSMGDIGDMLAELSTFRMSIRASAPGRILSYEPDWGKVDGGGVVWSMSMTEIMAMAGSGAASPEFPDRFRVRFQTDTPLPESVISEGGLETGELI